MPATRQGVLLWLRSRRCRSPAGRSWRPSAGPRPVPRRWRRSPSPASRSTSAARSPPARSGASRPALAALVPLHLARRPGGACPGGGRERRPRPRRGLAASPLCPARALPCWWATACWPTPPARLSRWWCSCNLLGLTTLGARWRWRGSGCRCAAGRCGWTGRRRRGRSGRSRWNGAGAAGRHGVSRRCHRIARLPGRHLLDDAGI